MINPFTYIINPCTAQLHLNHFSLKYMDFEWFGFNFSHARTILSSQAKALFPRRKKELDRGSIRSSPRYGLSTPYRLTIRNSARLFRHVLFNIGDLHFVLPALNLSKP